jgi:low temperature requirement protein LtrA
VNSIRLWWQKPQLHVDEEQGRERRVSWLELFYDLVFVVMIARLSHYLTNHIGVQGTLSYILLFIPVWWVWLSGTIYNDRFETYDISYRVFVFLQIVVVGAMSMFIEGGLGQKADAFAWSYVAARVLIIVLWLRGGRYNPSARPVTNRYAAGFAVSVVLWIVSTVVEGPVSFALKGLGLLFDFLTPVWTINYQKHMPRFSNSKLSERFGLFVIIVLGESIIGVLNGISESEMLGTSSLFRLILGMTLSFGLWWIYFDFIGRRNVNRTKAWIGLSWSQLHLPLVMGITAIASSLLHAMSFEGGIIDRATRLTLVGAYAVVMVSLSLLERTLLPEKIPVVNTAFSSNLKLFTALLSLVLGLTITSTTSVLMLLVLFNMGHMLYGAIAWFNSPVSRMMGAGSVDDI